MEPAALDRPARHSSLRLERSHLDRPADEVYAALVRNVKHARVRDGLFVADPDRRFVVVQGSWWYRGEYRVTPQHDGCTVSYEIVNVAPSHRWAARLVARKPVADAAADLARLVEEITTGA